MTPAKATFAVCLAGAMFVAGYLSKSRPAAQPVSAAAKPSYACPMHPDYKSAEPGGCPVCGMRLEALAVSGPASGAGAPGAVRIGAAQQQLMGVRTEVVEESSTTRPLRLLGRIAPDPSRAYRLIAATDGWVRELGRNSAGALVKQNEALASYFVRDLVSAQQNYLYAYQTAAAQVSQANAAPQRNTPALNLRLALDALRSLGMTDIEIEQLQRNGQPSPDLHLYSPVAGVVLARNLSPGQRFDKGAELYQIADLSRVFVVADVFEKDREFVRPGAVANVRYGGREFRARMTELLPDFDPQSRRLKARFELDNPGYVLRPDMFVDVEIEGGATSGITAPWDAVLDSGRRRIVYVENGAGVFEAREIKTGSRFGDRVAVTEGLRPGERIVVAGGFLIDSESRLRATPEPTSGIAAGTDENASAKDPVCGMAIARADLVSRHEGETYAFCSPKCKREFDASPSKYVALRMRP